MRLRDLYSLCLQLLSSLISSVLRAASLELAALRQFLLYSGKTISARARHSEESTVAAPERWGAASRRGAFGLPLAKQKNETFSIA